MAAQRKGAEAIPLEDRLPEQVSSNPAWVRAAQWFDECDKKQREMHKEAGGRPKGQEKWERRSGNGKTTEAENA